VIHDEGLSMGAKVLYFFLDDTGRGDGETPLLTQSQMSQAISASLRSVGEYLRELEERRYLTESRRSRGSVITLAWPLVGEQRRSAKFADQSVSDTQNLPITHAKFADHLLICKTANYYSERTLENSTMRCACGAYFDELADEAARCHACSHCHYPGGVCDRCVAADPLEEGTALLAGYVQQCGIPWSEPDVEIVQRSLEAAGGLVGLYSGLRFLLLERRAKPRQSYAWFPVVLDAAP
jgi:hypothetical protein